MQCLVVYCMECIFLFMMVTCFAFDNVRSTQAFIIICDGIESVFNRLAWIWESSMLELYHCTMT